MFRVCVFCQSLAVNDEICCNYCSTRFSDRVHRKGLIVRHQPVFTQSLWSWSSDSEELSRSLIYNLKGRSNIRPWKAFAVDLLSLMLQPNRRTCLIPIPSKSAKPDHAHGLATALHQLTGWPLELCLKAPDQRLQRGLSRLQRRQIHIAKVRAPKRSYDCHILVDDVVTSGATLKAGFMALEKPEAVWALCLMDRPLVAETV